MGGVKMGVVVGCMAVIVTLMVSSAAAGPPCNQVIAEFAPCMGFLRGSTIDVPNPMCCTGIQDISPFLIGRSDRTAVCECIKITLNKLTGSFDPNLFTLLPYMCGFPYIDLPAIDFDTECPKW